MKVVLADVEEPALDAAVLQLTQAEHNVIGVKTDVSSAESIEELARKTLDAFGKVHVVCNNAGVAGGRGLVWQGTLNDWHWVMGVNFWGVLHGVRAFVPIMLEQGEEGHIVNTSSLAGLGAGRRLLRRQQARSRLAVGVALPAPEDGPVEGRRLGALSGLRQHEHR